MNALHGDNAFRVGMLKVACDDHGIDLLWRPVKQPQYGGHIERMAGTLGEAIHYLPGTTFSDLRARGPYDSEGKSIFTMPELRRWLVERIAAYHAELHSELGMSPLKRYEIGVLKGTDKFLPAGIQPRITSQKEQENLRLDFMPYVERTVQRYGVVIDSICYYHDVLRRWINADDPVHPELKRKFRFRRFFPNLSSIWFFDPD